MSQKLKALKSELKSWNKLVFGNIHLRLEKALADVDNIQQQISSSGASDDLLEQEIVAQLELQQALNFEEEFWREKSRFNWHCAGDRNTGFFHRVTKLRHASKTMTLLKNGNDILENHEEIAQHVLHYFSTLYATSNDCQQNDLIDKVVPLSVSQEDNALLTKLPSSEEIKEAVFALNGDGAPMPNGFGGFFFQHFWDNISLDVCNSVKQFFSKGWMLPNLNANLVVLIPKVQGADRIEDFRPTALASFQFMIITKVLADRLSNIAPKIISHQQRGFIKDRHIKECNCIASEAVNLLDYKSFGGNLALKLDIRKAFDTLDWSFLLGVLKAFGFNSTFCSWIKAILESVKLSFLVNGQPVGFFSCKRGVRQGDPLSPLLFCIAEDVLVRGISHLVNIGSLQPFSGPKNTATPSHVLYVDDVLVFCKGTKQSLQALMHLFNECSQASGQHLSLSKCKFYLGTISARKSAYIYEILGFSAAALPFTYIGIPLFKGRPKKIHLQHIVDRFLNKLATWKGTLLSIMGRIELVKSVIQHMFLHSFQVYSWPISLLKHLDKCIRNFIWAGKVNVKKIVTVAWHKICSPTLEGGLGLKSIRSLNEASLLKLFFEMLSSRKEWVVSFRQRFSFINKPCIKYIKSSIWPGVKVNLHTVLDNSMWQIGDGRSINFWLDNWLSQPLAEQLQIPDHMHKDLKATVSDFIENESWIIPANLLENHPTLLNSLARVTIPSYVESDQLCWKGSSSGLLSFKDAFNFIRPANPHHFAWSKTLWNIAIPPSKSFIAWRLLNKRMPIDDNLQQRGCTLVSILQSLL